MARAKHAAPPDGGDARNARVERTPNLVVVAGCGIHSANTEIKENSMKITASKLIRWAGFSAMVAGILFVVIQPIHPPDTLSSVTTSACAIVHYLTIAMAVLGLAGITGIYARQVEEVGWQPKHRR